MIIDNLKNCRRYEAVHPRFKAAFDFLEKAMREDVPCGRYELDGDALYANVMEYTTKYNEDGVYEGHRNHIDVQCIVKGVEVIETIEIEDAEHASEYNETGDVEFYRGHAKCDVAVLEAGEYGIYFPNDVHRPGMPFNKESGYVKKIVVKVEV